MRHTLRNYDMFAFWSNHYITGQRKNLRDFVFKHII